MNSFGIVVDWILGNQAISRRMSQCENKASVVDWIDQKSVILSYLDTWVRFPPD